MKHLASVRANVFYAKKQKENENNPDEFRKFFELILLVDKAEYKKTNGGEVIRERGIEEMRFIVSEDNFDNLLKSLVLIKEADDSELS